MPEGLIDPMVKTITLARGEKALVRLHYYATHPQSFYGDGRVSADFVAFARDRIEAKEKVFQIYFTGCEGNITAGKYNDGSRAAREELAQRLMAGMQASIAATHLAPAGHLQWHATPITFKVKSGEKQKPLPAGKDEATKSQVDGAQRAAAPPGPISLELHTLTIGQFHVLHMPGECFIEFQLFAQQLLPTHCVAVAACCDNAPGYVCTEKAFSEGGYELTASRVAPASEHALKAAIRQSLGVN
jgi:hypothetical protein